MSTAQKVSAAKSIADMVIDWIDGAADGRQAVDWRTGLPDIIEKRLNRLALSAAPTPDAHSEVGVERIAQRISVFREMLPEEGEDWGSWYHAAFDMLAGEVASLTAGVVKAEPVAWRYRSHYDDRWEYCSPEQWQAAVNGFRERHAEAQALYALASKPEGER